MQLICQWLNSVTHTTYCIFMYPMDTLSIFFLFTYDTLFKDASNKKKKADIFFHILVPSNVLLMIY